MLYQFPILQTDYKTAKTVASGKFSLTSVYHAAFKIGRSIWDITRPDLCGEKPSPASPGQLASLPWDAREWPEDRAWSASACARWCVHVGLPLVARHMPPPPPKPLPPPVSGVHLLLDRPDPRITYPHAYVDKPRGEAKLVAYAASHGYGIDWAAESPRIVSLVSAPVFPLE
jgi:hypothetical protein